jgi:hypothetical protein
MCSMTSGRAVKGTAAVTAKAQRGFSGGNLSALVALFLQKNVSRARAGVCGAICIGARHGFHDKRNVSSAVNFLLKPRDQSIGVQGLWFKV